MNRRGRPPRQYTPVVIQIGDFILHPERDADLITFFHSVPRGRRISAIKAALRAGGLQVVSIDTHAENDELTEAAGGFL